MEAAENGDAKSFTPIEIKPKTSIRIHHTPNAGRDYFTLSYYDEDGKRQRRQFRDLATAEQQANKLAGKMGRSEPPGLLVTGRDRLIYERAVEAARAAGIDLDMLANVSGVQSARPGLDRCLAQLQQGDVLLVWRLDRPGRSMRHLLDLVDQLRQRGVGFKSLCDGVIDTTTASGELVFHIFTALAQFERKLIQERTNAGLAAARARGRTGGRKPIPADDPRVQMTKKMHADRTIPVPDICKTLRISRPTLYRYLAIE
ncbi:MAG: recombinase family protein [Verrucomicrobiota bacterium]